MLRVTECAVRLHLRVERVGRESTLFLKNFDVAQGAENTLFRRGDPVMSRGIPAGNRNRAIENSTKDGKIGILPNNAELPFSHQRCENRGLWPEASYLRSHSFVPVKTAISI